MIHKMLMAAAGAGEVYDPRYDIANIAYSGTAGPNIQSLAPRYAEAGEGASPINRSPLIYDMELYNNGQGIFCAASANVPQGYITADFAGGNYQIGTFGMFDSYSFHKPSVYQFGKGNHWVDSTTIITAYKDFSNNYIMKKYSLSTAWDITSFNNTATQTVTLPSSALTTDVRALKFNSTGTKFFIFSDNTNTGGEVVEFNLTSAYDLTTITNPNKSSTITGYQCVHMNAAGDKIFYVNDLQDGNIRLRTLTTPFDLDTISGSETIYSMTALNTMSKGNFCGLAMNEADSNYSAGELVFLAAGWSVNTTVTRGVMSTPFDLSTVTWDDPLPASGAKIGIMPNDTGSEPVYIISAGSNYMVSNANDFKAGRYMAHYEKDGNGVWRKEAFSMNPAFSASAITSYATTEVTNSNILGNPRGIQLTRGSSILYFSEENSGANQVVSLTYYSDNISNSNDPSVLTNPVTRDVTTWAKDGFTNTLNVTPIAAQLRVNAEYEFGLNAERRLWFLMEIGNPDAWYIRKMSSTSNQTQSNPNNWTLDTGTGNIWQLPFGAGGIGTGEIPTSLTVTPKGDKFLIMTGAGNLYLFNNDSPWDLDGTITLAQTATLPLIANSMPRNAWYNQDGTKLFVIDVTGFVYEYDCGT